MLVDQAQAPGAEARPAAVAECRHILSEHPYRAGRRRLQRGQDPQQGALPRAGRPDHGHHLAGSDLEVQALERRGVALGAAMDAEHLARVDCVVHGAAPLPAEAPAPGTRRRLAQTEREPADRERDKAQRHERRLFDQQRRPRRSAAGAERHQVDRGHDEDRRSTSLPPIPALTSTSARSTRWPRRPAG